MYLGKKLVKVKSKNHFIKMEKEAVKFLKA